MGFFDDLARMADKGLKAVESGALEDALSNGLDKLEAGLDKAVENAEKVADAPEKLLHAAEEKHAQATDAVKKVGEQAGKAMDVFKK